MLLADAGVIGPVPVSSAKHFEPSATIAVDITSGMEELKSVERGIDIILRVESIACARLNAIELTAADVVIQPQVGKKFWSDFSGFENLINEGVLAAQEKLSEIRAAVARGKKRTFLWRVLSPSG